MVRRRGRLFVSLEILMQALQLDSLDASIVNARLDWDHRHLEIMLDGADDRLPAVAEGAIAPRLDIAFHRDAEGSTHIESIAADLED